MTSKRILLTGATGAMGLPAVRALVEAGHQVHGIARSPRAAETLAQMGATPVEASLFDQSAVREAVRGVDVVAHFATRIPSGFSAVRRRAWHRNDRLRREATATLVEAAEAEGVRRVVFESISLAYPDCGDRWINESQALRPPSDVMNTALEAEAMLEEFARRGGEAVRLRFGWIYGPGRASNELIAGIRKRQIPIVGSGENYVSSIHVKDAARALVTAVSVAPGVYNVVDDEPLARGVLTKAIAASLNAPPPRQVPYAVARILVGHLADVLTASQRVSNLRFRQATGWSPRFASAIDGWKEMASSLRATEAAALAS